MADPDPEPLITMTPRTVPVVDLFAGPGGLGEGFASCHLTCGGRTDRLFRPVLSIEKDPDAHKTLLLRSFFRHFPEGEVPEAYYRLGREDGTTIEELLERFPDAASAAEREAVPLELKPENHERTAQLVRDATRAAGDDWVLVGGPPCQAYSLAGRSRNRGIEGYAPEEDRRHFLYEEFLRVLAEFTPPVFVLENVKGLLSATVRNRHIFTQMQADLRDPIGRLDQSPAAGRPRYHLYPLGHAGQEPLTGLDEIDGERDPRDFVIEMEEYGIPQKRHRLILLGVRRDRCPQTVGCLNSEQGDRTTAGAVISDLPRLRSGLSRGADSADRWMRVLLDARSCPWLQQKEREFPPGWERIREEIEAALDSLEQPDHDRGGEYVPKDDNRASVGNWFDDPRLEGVWNHRARSHMVSDLHRYLFASCFAQVTGRSPVLSEFPRDDYPEGLLPDHENVSKAIENGGYFSDRFRVQLEHQPATTITSHIAKDGHYYIHPDPHQCRSLTVREAARIQTFPDNYFFAGARTSQYRQVGNAVPPRLAAEIAAIIASDIFDRL